jgi:hypothetical protein
MNAGETAWVVGAEDVANIGRFFQTGVLMRLAHLQLRVIP